MSLEYSAGTGANQPFTTDVLLMVKREGRKEEQTRKPCKVQFGVALKLPFLNLFLMSVGQDGNDSDIAVIR